MHKVSAVIAAGGRGRRMQRQGNKVYLPINGRPVLAHTLEVFAACRMIDEIVVVVPQDERDFCAREVIAPLGISKGLKVTSGGEERQDSVRRGLRETSPISDFVVVHDGARPLLTLGLLEAVIREALIWEAAIAAVPVKDTVKIGDAQGFVVATPARDRLWSVQTPQAFKKEVLVKAHEFALANGILGTDDACLVEQLGRSVKIVSGDYENIKITTPEDLQLAEAILLGRRETGEGGYRV